MKAKFYLWGLLYFITTTSFVLKPKECLRVSIASFNGKNKLKSVFISVVDDANSVEHYNTGKEANVKLKLPLGRQYKLVFTKSGHESKLVTINAIPAGLYKVQTEILIEINLTRTKQIFPKPINMGEIFFDDENDLIVKKADPHRDHFKLR